MYDFCPRHCILPDAFLTWQTDCQDFMHCEDERADLEGLRTGTPKSGVNLDTVSWSEGGVGARDNQFHFVEHGLPHFWDVIYRPSRE